MLCDWTSVALDMHAHSTASCVCIMIVQVPRSRRSTDREARRHMIGHLAVVTPDAEDDGVVQARALSCNHY